MRLLFKFLRLVCVVVFCAAALGVVPAAFAQKPENKPPPRPATLRFLFLDETAGAYSLKIDATYRRISTEPYAISQPFVPPDMKRLEIYKTSAQLDPVTGLPAQVRVATVTPPADTTSALVILTPRPATSGAAESSATYAVEFIYNSPSAFPAGSLRILNRGRVAMAARIGSERVVAEPGSVRIHAPVVADARGRLRVLVAVQGSDQWRLIDDRVAILKPDTRLTGLLVYSPSGLKFRMSPDLLVERGDPPPSHVWLTYSDTP